jgi:hypothetical protein
MVFLTLFLAISAVDIGYFVYSSASVAFGGGKPQKALLILNQDDAATWSKLPGSINYDAFAKSAGAISSAQGAEPVLTPEIEIVYENESQLVIRWNPHDPNAIVMLDRKLVSAVIPKEHPTTPWLQ